MEFRANAPSVRTSSFSTEMSYDLGKAVGHKTADQPVKSPPSWPHPETNILLGFVDTQGYHHIRTRCWRKEG